MITTKLIEKNKNYRKQKNGRMYKIKLYAICCITYWTF